MNEQSQPAHIQDQGSEPVCPPLDAQLAELIEVVWACEVAARRDDRIDAAIKSGAAERPRTNPKESNMFARWGRFFYRRRWAVLALPDNQGDAWLPVST